ncbi:MAG: hypothetical protein PHR77_17680 [Kiritimatiellae bacterium]|nr:hypothetical protein [Kiritimatiellia bacterium]
MSNIKIGKTVVKSAALLLWSALLVFIFHHRAFAPELRYTRVAEGNISKGVYSIWSDGIHGYIANLRGDAYQGGRIRPLHQLYYCVPFILTMVLNGDIFYHDPEVPIKDRINGDLQTHVIYLFVSLVIAVSTLSWLTWCLTGAWWSALILPIYAVSNTAVCENFLVNYCDSGEIGQLLFISLYLASMAKALEGKVPRPWVEVSGICFLLMAFAMKETTIVLVPVVMVLLAWGFFRSARENREFRRFAVRHAMIIGLLTCLLLIAVYVYRSGNYVSQNYKLQEIPLDRIGLSLEIMCSAIPLLPMFVVGSGLAVIVSILAVRSRIQYATGVVRSMTASTIGIIVFAGIFAGFWVINLPWSGMLVKYYLPVFVFASTAVLLIQVLVIQMLWQQRLYAACMLWAVGSIVFMTSDIGGQYKKTRSFYRDNYEYRKTVPVVAQNIRDSSMRTNKPGRVHIVAGRLFQEGVLPFCRQLNRFHDINIAQKGTIVSRIKACEKNYFRRYPGRPAVEVTLSEGLPKVLDANDVYLVGDVAQNEANQMESCGYQFCMERSVGNPGIRVARYTKRKL